MNNEPVAYINVEERKLEWAKPTAWETPTIAKMDKVPLYTQEQLEEARKLGMQQERALWNLSESTQEIMNTHPVKEQGNPVAWRSQDLDGYWCIYQSPVKGAEPLYTGFKELTDEEIRECIHQIDPNKTDMFMSFARAILRKASEK